MNPYELTTIDLWLWLVVLPSLIPLAFLAIWLVRRILDQPNRNHNAW